MRQFFILILFFSVTATAQQVPSKMTVAGMKVTLSNKLQEELQKEVDALTASPKYFQIKVDRAKVYFPIIERIFAEENVPDDIKYLVLQESALIPDAVSVSDAVGYWQFKDFTAMEVGMRVDRNIDERMHIMASSRGAARYLKKNFAYFDNWIFAIQAYQMGAGGAMKVVDKNQYGAKSMFLDHNLYWYVKKYIAHKIAFENAVDGPGPVKLDIYDRAANKTLEQVAKETSVDYEQLSAYNVWLRKGRIPDDKVYPVLLPVTYGHSPVGTKPVVTKPVADIKKDEPAVIPQRMIIEEQHRFPVVEVKKSFFSNEQVRTFNGIPGIEASEKQTLVALAAAGDVSLARFLKYNDITVSHRPAAGDVYYFKRKKAKAKTYYHIVEHEESLWEIAQRYGIRMNRLMHKNRLHSEKDIKPGLVLWLRHVRPENVPAEYKEVQKKKEPAVEKKKEEKPVVAEVFEEKNEKDAISEKPTEVLIAENKPKETQETQEPIEPIDPSQGSSGKDPQHGTEEAPIEIITEEAEDDDGFGTTDSIENNNSDKGFIFHTVTPGETFYALAKKYDVTVVDILEWNELKITDKLTVGKEVKILQQNTSIAAKETLNLQEFPKETFHEVKEGETLYQIARKYGLTVERLMELNERKDYTLSIGELLLIKK